MKHSTLRFSSYVAGALVIGFGTFLLVAYGNGYTYDLKTHTLVHNGLLLLDSAPSGAQVIIDGKPTDHKTPYRKTLPAGEHQISLNKSGYRPWEKTINVLASTVSQAQYAILFASKLTASTIESSIPATLAAQSFDRRYLSYYVPAGPKAGVWVIDTASRSRTKLYTPIVSPAGLPEAVTAMQWSRDGSRLLITTATPEQGRQVVVLRSGTGAAIDLTSTQQMYSHTALFNPRNPRELYWLASDGLRRVDIESGVQSLVLAERIAGFAFADDRVVYIGTTRSIPELWSLDRAGHRQRISAALPAASGYEIAYASYRGVGQLAVLPISSGNALLYSDPFSNNTSVQTVLLGVDHLAFNATARYLLGYGPGSMQTYDIERHQAWRFDGGTAVTNVSWFDDFHIMYDANGQTWIREFDGANAADIAAASGLGSYSSADARLIFLFSGPVDARLLQDIEVRPAGLLR